MAKAAEVVSKHAKRIRLMSQVKAIVLRAAGINCDMETQYALEMAGAQRRADTYKQSD